MHRRKLIILWAIILLVAFSGVMIGRWSTSVSAEGKPYKELKVFTEVLSLIKENYVEETKNKDLVYGAIRGMLRSLDPHSHFMTPEAFRQKQVDTKGEFGGLGIQIGIRNDALTVIAPMDDTPAYKAGIKAGDRIIRINNESTKDMGIEDAVSKLRGPKGTSVTISIMREGWEEPKDFKIVREIIKIQSVKSKVLDDRIGYIRISHFHEKTTADLAEALKKLEAEKIDSLILDVRNNPGGLLNIAVDVSSQFLPSGKRVVYIKGRDGEKIEYYTSSEKPYYKYPMVVLVNEGSASASEIVAGALKDWGRAVIIGTQTFGKGSVQTLIPLSDGSGLKLTTAKYYTPKDKSIQTTGITPDIVVKNEQQKEKETVPVEVAEKDDTQLQRAIDLLKTWRIFKELPKAG
ncbi:MAG TPA: peptidase S41 [Nitrospiraceae bacterium]|nr:peptidase S41 [Nitrospiraceae bacterium]